MAGRKRPEQNTTETQAPSQEQTQRTNEQQMMDRQSAPKMGMTDFVAMRQAQMAQQSQTSQNAQIGSVNGFRAIAQPINEKALHEAVTTLQKYKEGKANLENRIVENEQWYKLRHWEHIKAKNSKKKKDIEPTSAWLFNSLANKHADAMDNFPSPNVLPREADDKEEAKCLSSIIPVVLDHCNFEQVYDEVWTNKLKSGTGCYGIFWDSAKLNGLGDISIQKIDIINLFWEPGISDIQDSANLFYVTLVDNELLNKQYPQTINRLSTPTVNVSKYIYDDTVDTTTKSAVIDWYYKRVNSQGKQVLHFCKFVNDVVITSTENDPTFAETGLYDHGRYPFEFDTLFRVEGSPAGFGYIDVGRSCQEYIDRGNQAILTNMLVNAKPRHFINNSGAVNEQEYADLDNDFIHVDGHLGSDSIMPVETNPLNDIYVTILHDKIDELKETTGNRDISTGGTTSGVTAASAIAAMQEAGSKLSRDANKASYRVFRQICLDCIELIRQFYTIPRWFRIIGREGAMEFIQYSNAGIVPHAQGLAYGTDMGMRLPLFDVEVTAQKQSPYSKMAQNELALQLYSAGFFNPQMADQALACLDMMDFDHKDFVVQKVSQNGTMYQMIMQMQQQMMALGQMVDASRGGNEVTMSLANQFGLQMPGQPMANGSAQNVDETEALGGEEKEASNTKKARQRVAESTAPA